MSLPLNGAYTPDLFNSKKRYRLGYNIGLGTSTTPGYCKAVPLSDSELRELQMTSDAFIRQLVAANFTTGSSTNNGFKVVQSGVSTANNFTIQGGDGTVNGAGDLFVDGYLLFLKGNIEYNQQDATGLLTDDDYTQSSIPAAVPAGPGTLQVYVDFYFAEVSATAGSEYQDTSLIVTGIGTPTANRARSVQDVRCTAIGATIQTTYSAQPGYTDYGNYVVFQDANSITHYAVKIATILRDGTANIFTSMITDNRTLINPAYSYMNGTTLSDYSGNPLPLLLTNAAAIGNDSHRISTIYMASTIDYKTNDLVFSNNGTEKIRFTTAGNIGIGTDNPQLYSSYNTLTINGTAGGAIVLRSSGTNAIRILSDASHTEINELRNLPLNFATNGLERMRINGDGKIGLGTATITEQIDIYVGAGTCFINGNLKVTGTSTTINTETTATDMLQINQDDAQVGLQVNKTNVGTGNAVEVTNNGTGYALIVGIGTTGGNANVGIGTTSPSSIVEVYTVGITTIPATLTLRSASGVSSAAHPTVDFYRGASLLGRIQGDTANTYAFGMQYMVISGQNHQFFLDTTGSTEAMRIASTGNVGIGTTNTGEKLVIHPATNVNLNIGVNGALLRIQSMNDASSSFIGQQFVASSFEFAQGSVVINTTDAVTNTTTYVLSANHLSTSTTAAGFGSGISFGAQNFPAGTPVEIGRIRTELVTFNTSKMTLSAIYGTGGWVDGIIISPISATVANVGIGTSSPQHLLHAFNSNVGGTNSVVVGNSDNTNASSHARLLASSGGASGGDPYVLFDISGIIDWSAGVDNSDSDKFKISYAGTIGTNDRLIIDSTGKVGIGSTSPVTLLDVEGDVSCGTPTSNSQQLRVTIGTTGTGVAADALWVQNLVGSDVAITLAHSATVETASIRASNAGNNDLKIYTRNELIVGQDQAASFWFVYPTGSSIYDGNARIGVGSTANTFIGISTSATPDMYFGTNNLERMRITGAGKVGIGTTIPLVAALHVKSSDVNMLRLNGSTGQVDFNYYATDSAVRMTTISNLNIFSGGNLKITADGGGGDDQITIQSTLKNISLIAGSSGYVTIGTTAAFGAVEKLQIPVATSVNGIGIGTSGSHSAMSDMSLYFKRDYPLTVNNLGISAGSTGSTGVINVVVDGGTRFRVGVNTTLITNDIDHNGTNIGFYSAAPIPQQTGVAVNAAAIHAALVNLGLITA